ncbi:hypothetical protein NDU88_005418 [Pleurodeles waltl]|uniref:Uncharacterized protein n=1 Tax=Pleurodeles waltl TaxID=8319 RepID=A0AAV7TUR7_PLEWA|nr:hypothetical protein NDU88_005418 [Pleurodeles waltl]
MSDGAVRPPRESSLSLQLDTEATADADRAGSGTPLPYSIPKEDLEPGIGCRPEACDTRVELATGGSGSPE